ncbi:MAG: TetR/AcrR family transcriptional regulator [Comamonadaceae bacterium]|nr:MAG: TetR/AcrR family transcriptional regulator [Comamonadaceae bacterium]
MPASPSPLSALFPPAVTPELPARERILWTAYSLFYCDGVRATGIDKVIAEAGVTKVTFYRHFPSKNDLVLAFLQERHVRWMAWFDEALQRHGNSPRALAPALGEWLCDATFRGCAFLNTSAELGATVPEVCAAALEHKDDVSARIQALLPPSRQRAAHARLLCMVMDGAIARALYEGSPHAALAGLAHAVALLPAGR